MGEYDTNCKETTMKKAKTTGHKNYPGLEIVCGQGIKLSSVQKRYVTSLTLLPKNKNETITK